MVPTISWWQVPCLVVTPSSSTAVAPLPSDGIDLLLGVLCCMLALVGYLHQTRANDVFFQVNISGNGSHEVRHIIQWPEHQLL